MGEWGYVRYFSMGEMGIGKWGYVRYFSILGKWGYVRYFSGNGDTSGEMGIRPLFFNFVCSSIKRS